MRQPYIAYTEVVTPALRVSPLHTALSGCTTVAIQSFSIRLDLENNTMFFPLKTPQSMMTFEGEQIQGSEAIVKKLMVSFMISLTRLVVSTDAVSC